MICPLCEASAPADSRFCPQCGGRLAANCAGCGQPLDTGDRFCRQCGTPAAPGPGAPATAGQPGDQVHASSPAVPPRPRVAERRRVSVLFADLVGFTPFSEARDPEEVREVLTRYFDRARTVITRYGGAVEKFIGDAVMAVWGAPTAQEDDAERAVRAALELVAAVTELGAEVGAADLQLRAGVVTGEAAVTLGAQGQGMVAGDVVNTASRVQASAPPGAVLVDDTTRRLTEAPIAYEDAGRHELKGRSEPVHLWHAIRVVAMVGGKWRAGELEAPFVGRDGEFRLLKELFHTTIEERRARLVSVSGLAGVGKTRLAWEFEKYVDGLQETILWHRGRCPAYGEGVTYWALAEMVRRRCGILEAEAPGPALEKMHEALPGLVPDAEERRWLEPRLAHLLGLEDRTSPDRVELFAAWRLFFERLAEQSPTVLVFEEFQWADAGLVEFVEYLLDWSRHHPLFIVTLARPELVERHPTWGSGKRSFHAMHLEPLPDAAMDELLAGLVPGLPADLAQRISARAQGVPLYAVETVRMLLDRGVLQRQGNRYAVAGPVDDLAVPESLHSLIAARLDALPSGERSLLQDAAVLGQSFSRERLAVLARLDDAVIAPVLDSLVHKELLSVTTDPRSPERGQYCFLQALVQRVAYETLSRHDRKARHLDAARHLEATWARDGDDVVEVVAAHYMEAFRAARDDEDTGEVAASARRMLLRAGMRAQSLGSTADAERYFVQAGDLADDPVERALLLEQAGEMARRAGHASARRHFEQAIELLDAAGQSNLAARVEGRVGSMEVIDGGHPEAGIARMERAFEVLRSGEPSADLGRMAGELGRAYVLLGRQEDAAEPLELAITVAESEGLPDLLAEALISKSFVLALRGRRAEPMALQQHALSIALENDVPQQAMRAHFNLADLLVRADRYEEAVDQASRAMALARRIGYRDWELRVLSNYTYPLYLLGRWDEISAETDRTLEMADDISAEVPWLRGELGMVAVLRGDLDAARRALSALLGRTQAGADPQVACTVAAAQAFLAFGEGRYADAAAAGERAFGFIGELGPAEMLRDGFAIGVDAALAGGDVATAEALLQRAETLPRNNATPYLTAHVVRLRARLAALAGDHGEAVAGFASAEERFAELGVVFWRAVAMLEHAECLLAAGRAGDEAEPLLAEAGEVFTRLDARLWSDRVARLAPETPVAVPSA